MTIDIKELDEVKKVNKPWGYEKWIADGKPNFKYVLKEILFKSNFKSSIQFHEFKEETNYVQSGTGILHYYPEPVNIKEWKNGHYSNEEIDKILKNLKQQKLSPGVVFHVKSCMIHRVEAITDLTLLETSTVELDDVIRINDEWGRHDGKISKEHQKSNLILDDVYTKQEERYNFASKFCSGLTLDYNVFSIMAYHGSKILLKNANKVITCDVSNNNLDYSSRKYDSNNNLIFSSMDDTFKLENKTFDCIIHSELLQNEMNPETKLEEFNNLLKDDGTLIVSILNNENQNLIYNKSDNVEFLSKDELLNLLKKQFSQINLYSQKLVTKKEIINRRLHSFFLLKVKLRFFLSTILLKFDPKSNFYNKIIKTKIRRLNTEFADQSADIDNSNKVVSNDYTPIPYSENDNPLFFIAVCKKNSN
tara:strand:+ start:7935 stop:9194 length:1260 start_codon:yes stop_codon:yes gene_type:complete